MRQPHEDIRIAWHRDKSFFLNFLLTKVKHVLKMDDWITQGRAISADKTLAFFLLLRYLEKRHDEAKIEKIPMKKNIILNPPPQLQQLSFFKRHRGEATTFFRQVPWKVPCSRRRMNPFCFFISFYSSN